MNTALTATAAASFAGRIAPSRAQGDGQAPFLSPQLKIATVQMNALKGNLEHNLGVHRRFIREAAAAGCGLIMFPELSVTAHFAGESATESAENVSTGRIYQALLAEAAAHRILVAYGFCESAHGTFYNSCALVGPDGLIGVHRKVHPSRDEYTHFRMGRSLEIFEVGEWNIGILICYDANFFEAWRVLAIKGADLLLLPHAGRSGPGVELTVEEQKRHLTGVFERMPGRYGVYAADNCVYAVYGNQIGYNGHSTHSGGAYIAGPDGKLRVKSKPTVEDHWISAEIDKALQYKCRNSPNSTLKDRRPEMYGELVKMM